LRILDGKMHGVRKRGDQGKNGYKTLKRI
jgi:hypothetical protein